MEQRQQQQQQPQQPQQQQQPSSSSLNVPTPLTKVEKELIRDLSEKYKILKEKDPTFDSKNFLQKQLSDRCGVPRAKEILEFMKKMTSSRNSAHGVPPQQQQQQLLQQQQMQNFQQSNQLARISQPQQMTNSGLYLNNTAIPNMPSYNNLNLPPGDINASRQPQHLSNQMYPQSRNQLIPQQNHPHHHQHPQQQQQYPQQFQQPPQQQQQQQYQQQYHSQTGMNQLPPNKEHIIKKEGQPNNPPEGELERVNLIEDLQVDPTTITQTYLQLNILTDKDVKTEFNASDQSLRQSLTEEDRSMIPGVGVIARPNMIMENPSTRNLSLQTNVLDEIGINSAINYLGKPQIQISHDAAMMLSEGIQMHLSQLIDAAIVHSRKRTNRTATEHFQKTQLFIEKEAPHSARGEIFPENRGNLGMLWGPPIMEQLEEYTLRTNDQYNEKRIRLTENLVNELKSDDEKRVQKKKGPGSSSVDIPKDVWWLKDEKIRELGIVSLEDIAMMRFKSEIAKKYDLGPQSNRKKAKKDDEDDDTYPLEVFTPTFRPNQVIRYESLPLTHANWTRQPCPLSEKDKHASVTITQADVISAISKNRGNDLGCSRNNIDFGTSLRIAKSISIPKR